jgi:hypothetical protein
MEGAHTFRGLKVIESYFFEVVSKSKPLFLVEETCSYMMHFVGKSGVG